MIGVNVVRSFLALAGIAAVALPSPRRMTLSAEPLGAANHSGPTPVALVGDGRTGSANLMIALAKMTGSCAALGMEGCPGPACPDGNNWPELFGGKVEDALNIENPKALLANFLSRVPAMYPDSPLVGFHWKTMGRGYAQMRTAEYEAAWQYLASQKVKALHYTRNHLDEYLSAAKHKAHKVPPHCDPDDLECRNVTMQPFEVDVDNLVSYLPELALADQAVLEDLHAHQIDYLNVSYEELENNDNATSKVLHWQRVLDFLGVRMVVTEKGLGEAFSTFTVTHPEQQGGNVVNWKAVVDALQQSEEGRYSYLLRDLPL